MISHNATGNGNREGQKLVVIGQSAAKRLDTLVNHGMMVKVQRLVRKDVGSSDPKRGGDMKRPLKERFEEKVNVIENGCHEWTGCLAANGYGMLHLNGKTAFAHRVAFELANGQIMDKSYVLHLCDNRKCVNPDHLFLGTFQDNMDDMVSKMRHAVGEKNGHAKLNAEQVREIRAIGGSNTKTAAVYGVTPGLVSMIRSGRIWKHV